MPKEIKPIKNRFNYEMNWKHNTFKIVDTHTGKTMVLREWNMIKLSNLIPKLILEIVRKKGRIMDADGKIYTKEALIETIKQNEQQQRGKTKDIFEAHPDSDEPATPSAKK